MRAAAAYVEHAGMARFLPRSVVFFAGRASVAGLDVLMEVERSGTVHTDIE